MIDSPFVDKLRSDLESRLSAVTAEAVVIRQALIELTPVTRGRRVATVSVTDEVVRELRGAPAARASLLALALRRDVDQVKAALRELETSGRIERDGLGWRIRDEAVSARQYEPAYRSVA